jgi:hypothetical protein
MTLIEQAQTLEELAKRRRDRQLRESEAQKFRLRTQNLSGVVARIRRARTRWEIVSSNGFAAEPLPAGSLKKLDVYAAVAEGQVEAGFHQAEWDSLVRTVKSYADRVETSVQETIDGAKKNLLEGASAAAIKGYTHDPATKAAADGLLAMFATLSDRNWNGVSEIELGTLLQQGRRFRDEFKALQEQGASDVVRTFLAAARSEAGAEFDALTDDVRRELEQRRLFSRVRLVIR